MGDCKNNKGAVPSAGACCCPLVDAMAPSVVLLARSSSSFPSSKVIILFLFPIGGIFSAGSSLQFFVGNTLATSFAPTLLNTSSAHLHHEDVFVFVSIVGAAPLCAFLLFFIPP